MTKPDPPGASRARTVTDPSSLTLAWLLDEMVKGGLIAPSARKELIGLPPRKDGEKHHPLVVAAAQDWPDRRTPGRKLTVEVLTQWFAHRVRLPYVRIDPLKLDVATITEVGLLRLCIAKRDSAH
jgi:general secretion pathway protein E